MSVCTPHRTSDVVISQGTVLYNMAMGGYTRTYMVAKYSYIYVDLCSAV